MSIISSIASKDVKDLIKQIKTGEIQVYFLLTN